MWAHEQAAPTNGYQLVNLLRKLLALVVRVVRRTGFGEHHPPVNSLSSHP